MNYTIDATNKKLGRVATEAAALLIGKNKADYKRNAFSGAKVSIVNASKVDFDAKKLTGKKYIRYTGFPGGLKKVSAEEMIAKKGYAKLFWYAVYGMLPTNKLRAIMIRNLTITE